MKKINKNIQEIKSDNNLNLKFLSIKHNTLNVSCNILKENFFLDSANYFPITYEYESFLDVFSWGENNKYKNFYSENFLNNFKLNVNSFKKHSNVFVLGSSLSNNYFRNIITFLPRIFFINQKKIRLCIHRNSSNKLRTFIDILCKQMKIDVQFVFLDDGFFRFENSMIPEFLQISDSIKILNSLKIFSNKKKEKIYLSRQNSSYRNLINEQDVVDELKKKNFRVVDLNNYSILQQIELFSNAETIVSPSGSSLTNIVFCNPGTNIIEITPKYEYEYEDNLKNRFSSICNLLDLNYSSIVADPIPIKKIKNNKNDFIITDILNQSNYYKNLLVKLNELKQIN